MLLKSFTVLFLLLNTSVFCQLENPYEQYKVKWKNKEVPNFKATTIEGKTVELKKLRNKIVLLNFWFTNCSGCKLEFPGLQTLKARFKTTDDVVLISIANDNESILTNFLKTNPLDFEHIANGKPIADEKFQVLGYPTNIIIDKSGIIKHIKIGGSKQSADDIEYEIKQLLK